MAVYRNLHVSFWTDAKIVDKFTPDDRYFYLYVLSNPHTNICGCYEISLRQVSQETGYKEDKVLNLIKRLETELDVLRYSRDTSEMLVINWNKYNWTKSPKLVKSVEENLVYIKNQEFKEYVKAKLYGNDTVSIGYQYPMDTSDTDTVSDSITDSNYSSIIKTIIDYLNKETDGSFTYKNKENNGYIIARYKEGHGVEDFKKVIDVKASQWLNDPKMKAYLRPNTLFLPSKFEAYLSEYKKYEKDMKDRNKVVWQELGESDEEWAKRAGYTIPQKQDDMPF